MSIKKAPAKTSAKAATAKPAAKARDLKPGKSVKAGGSSLKFSGVAGESMQKDHKEF